MKISQNRAWLVVTGLVALMALTRFNHFGSATSLPDASWAVFFLGGLYLAGYARLSLAVFAALLLQAGWMDYYATSVQGISDWCMTPAYAFLIPTYGSLWLAGRWFGLHRKLEGKGLMHLTVLAWAATSLAFLISNASFYLLSEHFAEMGVVEYAAKVADYYVSYVSTSMLYIACVIGVQMLIAVPGKGHQLPRAS